MKASVGSDSERPVGSAENAAIRVLVVDDDVMLCEAVQELLEVFGFQVDTAYDSRMAANVVRQRELDVVVLDATLTVNGDLSLYTQLRSWRPDLPIIIASGYDRGHLTQRFPECSDAQFIQKPWAIQDLVDLLVTTVEQSRQQK